MEIDKTVYLTFVNVVDIFRINMELVRNGHKRCQFHRIVLTQDIVELFSKSWQTRCLSLGTL